MPFCPRPLGELLDLRRERAEEGVLHVDWQGEEPVEVALDGRQVLQHHALDVREPQRGPVGERLVGHRLAWVASPRSDCLTNSW